MDHFTYINGQLHAEGVSAQDLVDRFGSPVYVYSSQTLRDHVAVLQQAFAPVAPLVCYSVKSCSNLSVLRLLVEQGCGLDVVSGGELHRALAAGAAPDTIVFAGVGKSADEVRYALEQGVFMFNVESEGELQRIDQLAVEMGRRARVAIRVNPDVADAATPEKTSTGGRQTKFGIPLQRAKALYAPQRYRHTDVCGVHVHLGSPIADIQTYLTAIDRLEVLIADVEAAGGKIGYINIGGGFPARYGSGDAGCSLSTMGKAICARLAALHAQGRRFIVEPGRSISANAGILLTRVEYLKQGCDHKLAIVDAGMNVLLRPTLYGAEHFIWPAAQVGASGHWTSVAEAPADHLAKIDVVGPICETGDHFALARPLPPFDAGGILAIFSCGAYGMSMASQYNSRCRPAEVLVDGNAARVIRKRETYDDLLAHEIEALRQAGG